MMDPVARAFAALEARRAWEKEYRAAVVAAVDAGASYSALAEALGVTRQTVRVIVERARARADA